ncbi:LOB domain-containing protein 41-like [Cynara cardunculus var. scolymus]|uniref:Lateral organ boundaries domain-containing protein n=1 Tax=Cynara cardunculus var. scolymus TaxID=59895 RepID=A0A103Y5A8_CYNCS|nr:LOB domain-containing protein 41-like [Cynara cardunculus var. scolymus]KVI02798.1 lateral organ boundaries domain-containing protein [Cynara cardunculus var. scolymus]
MRMSCNGCRVLRKGCSDDCSIRPCLQWIKSPESQANATVFLAKFYGRAGLMNLINAGPENLRPGIFRSLLYEACGRIVNPIYGSVGLLWSGRWQLCQNAVEAVLNGSPIVQVASDTEETNNGPPLKAYDIRHISKDENSGGSNELHRIRTRCRFKRSASKGKAKDNRVWVGSCEEVSGHDEINNRSSSHESTLSHQSEAAHVAEGESHETAEESLVSVETAEGSAAAPVKIERDESATIQDNNDEIGLELTLGYEPVRRSRSRSRSPQNVQKLTGASDNSGEAIYRMELGLDYPV